MTLLDAPAIQLGFKELLKWVEIWLLMVLVVDLGRDRTGRVNPRRLWLVVALLLLAGLTQAVLGGWQFVLRGTAPIIF